MKILVVSAAIAIASVGAADSSLFDKAVGDVIVESASQCETIYGVATSDPSTFSTLVTAVNNAGLADELDDADATLTLFAPTNSAFSKLPCGLLDKLLNPTWKPQLVDLLQYHVLGAFVSAPYEAVTYMTLIDETIDITNGDGLFPTINKGKNSARIDTKDVCASNGVVHVINNVLTPLSVTSNVVDIAVENPGSFSTLVTALNAAGLIGALEGAGPFTVFAPTNDAFAELPDLADLLLPANIGKLKDILLYHVVPGNYLSTSLQTMFYQTLLGPTVKVTKTSSAGVTVKGGTVTADVINADFIASNGIIHVINKVLLPPAGYTRKPTKRPTKKPTKRPTKRPGYGYWPN